MNRLDDLRIRELEQELQDAKDEGRKCALSPVVLKELLASAENEATATRCAEIETARANRAERYNERYNAQLFEQLSELRLEIADLREAVTPPPVERAATLEGG